MRNVSKAALAMAAGFAVACGGGTKGDIVLVGYAVDGQTGAAINFFQDDGTVNLTDDKDSTSQIYTLINGVHVRAEPCGKGFVNEDNKVSGAGCFRIPNIPYNQQLPIFAVHDGYEKFHGTFSTPTIVSNDGALDYSNRQYYANIRMFPRNFAVEYKLMVTLGGRGINGMTVACQIRQENVTLTTDGDTGTTMGDFIPPLNVTSPAISAVSGNSPVYGDGYVALNGADLVLGAMYQCQAFKADGTYGSDGVLTGSLQFRAGVDAPELAFPVKVTRTVDSDLLYAIWSNADDADHQHGDKGSLRIAFNRPVEIIPASYDCLSYGIAYEAYTEVPPGTLPPEYPTDIPDNNKSEFVTVTSENNDTVLTFAFKDLKNQPSRAYYHAAVSFSGIYVRPKLGSSPSFPTDDLYLERSIGGAGLPCDFNDAGRIAPLKNVHTGANQTTTIFLY